MDIKFYENKVNLNWKHVLKSIVDVSHQASNSNLGLPKPIADIAQLLLWHSLLKV